MNARTFWLGGFVISMFGAALLAACGSPPATLAPTAAAAPTATTVAVVVSPLPAVTTAANASASPTAKPTVVPKETEVSFQNGDLQLRGFIWKPEGNGPFPALLWNHGSEKLPGWLPDLGPVFVSQGYVFLVPHRRGQGRSSGTYIQDSLDKITNISEKSKMLVQLHDTEQFSDQVAGLKYLQSLAYVDRSKIAVAGCSYGGIQTLIAAEKNPGYRAAVDFAGGAMSWKSSPDLQVRLRTAARNLAVPTFFIQAENDFDLSPTKELPIEAQNAGKPYKAQIYPPAGTTNQDGHDFCVKGIAVWGKDVFPFLSANMK
jgi:dienelactone hydrolase